MISKNLSKKLSQKLTQKLSLNISSSASISVELMGLMAKRDQFYWDQRTMSLNLSQKLFSNNLSRDKQKKIGLSLLMSIVTSKIIGK